MKLQNILLAGLLALAIGGFSSCSSDDDGDNKEPEVVTVKGATKQVMVVFAPGQLGDKGFADRVLDGINLIETDQEKLDQPEADMDYISLGDPAFTISNLKQWMSNARNPFTGKDYEQRLLVLTEPYMLEWLANSDVQLRPGDEVLVLKAIQDDVDNAADLGLGNRLHALNISAARSARRYSEYMDFRIAQEVERGRADDIDANSMNILRLYDEEEVAYRDSVCETLMELRGEELEFSPYTLSALENYGTYSPLLDENIIQAAYDSGLMLNNKVSTDGTIFTFVDLGTANLSFDYYLMRQPGFSYTTLMLDAQPSSLRRFAIDRRFDLAVSEWVTRWIDAAPGELPQATSFSSEKYCEDNISTDL